MTSNYLFTLLLLSLMTGKSAYAQNKTPQGHFTEVVREEKGDLNHDRHDDKVIVKMDIIDQTRPLLLQVFLSQPDKKLKLTVSSAQLIEPQYPVEKKGKFNGYQIPDFFIEDGSLLMRTETEQGNITHEFKLRKGNFELTKVIRFTYNNSSNITTDSEHNLLTGLKTETEKHLGSEKAVRKRSQTLKVKPLLKLQDFKYTDREKY